MQFIREYKKILIIGVVLILAITLPISLYLVQQQQDIRQHASTTPQVCTTDQATDTMIIFDQSGSMTASTSTTDPTPRIDSAKKAASAFLDILAARTAQPLHAASLTTITSEKYVATKVSLTRSLDKVKTALNALTPAYGTCIECGIRTAMADFGPNERNSVKNIAVILTDGGATQYIGGIESGLPANKAEADKRALAAALEAYNTYHMSFYTIGFGNSLNDKLLIDIATQTGGKYFFAPDSATLSSIYIQIAQEIGKGSISGDVYQDTNSNGIKDSTESPLANWNVELLSATGTVIGTTVTDQTGHYVFGGMCDGSYSVKLTLQQGWTQVTPLNNALHSALIAKAIAVTDKDFGVTLTPPPTITIPQAAPPTANPIPSPSLSPTQVPTAIPTVVIPSPTQIPTATPQPISPTATLTPNTLTIAINLFLDGIGASGDKKNPHPTPCTTTPRDPKLCTSNQNPLRGVRDITISLSQNGNVVTKKTGPVTYDTAKGIFSGSMNFGVVLAGTYDVSIKTDYYLSEALNIGQLVAANQTLLTLPSVQLIAGDIDRNDTLNILDYNALIDCYSNFQSPINCTPTKKQDADINDDGKVNQLDLNLFLREWTDSIGAESKSI